LLIRLVFGIIQVWFLWLENDILIARSRIYGENSKMKKVVIIALILIGGVVQWAKASTGQLEIINKADNMPQNCIYTMDHWSGSSEGYVSGAPDYDTDYNPLWTPSGFKTKLISVVDGHELEYDSRPLDNDYVGLELSLHDKEGDPITVTSNNYLEFTIDPQGNGWDFGAEPITLQQYDPCDANACYPEYDVRKVINLDGGVIPLPNLNGTYNSEEPYAYFELAFESYRPKWGSKNEPARFCYFCKCLAEDRYNVS